MNIPAKSQGGMGQGEAGEGGVMGGLGKWV